MVWLGLGAVFLGMCVLPTVLLVRFVVYRHRRASAWAPPADAPMRVPNLAAQELRAPRQRLTPGR